MSGTTRWDRVKALFQQALEHPAAERATFLRDACGGDEALHREVESQLVAHDQMGAFVEGSPLTALGESAVASFACNFQRGARLGPYEILSLIGRGGMGEVYSARDSRLKRKVALKVLPVSFASDQKRLRRFEREARAAAALNHPNILNIFDIGQEDAAVFLVTELLEGKTVRAHLRAGAISIERILIWSAEIATGLAAAHDKRIVHRDLKPENIFVTTDERVKILDFGLATLSDSASTTMTQIISRERLTDEGEIVGTIRYMAPERFFGAPVLPSGDIFSFGLVLHELFTGRALFDYSEATAVIAAITTYRRYDTSLLESTAARPFAGLVARCLVREPALRPTAAQLVLTLRESRTLRDSRAAGGTYSPGRSTARVRRPRQPRDNAAAAEHAHGKARFLMDAQLENWLQDSFLDLQKAITAAPALPAARIDLSRWYLLAALRGEIPYKVGLVQAANEAERGLHLAPTSSAALAAVARAYYAQRRFSEAEQIFSRAIDRDPSDVAALCSYSEFRSIIGRHNGAIQLVNRALDLDPMSGIAHYRKACALFASRQFQAAAEWCASSLNLSPTSGDLLYFAGASRLMLGRDKEALDYFARALDFEPKLMTARAAMVVALARVGRGEESAVLLRDLERRGVDPALLAEAYAGVNELDLALASLEEGFRRDSPHVIGIGVNALLDPVREHPRFRRLLRVLGLGVDVVTSTT